MNWAPLPAARWELGGENASDRGVENSVRALEGNETFFHIAPYSVPIPTPASDGSSGLDHESYSSLKPR